MQIASKVNPSRNIHINILPNVLLAQTMFVRTLAKFLSIVSQAKSKWSCKKVTKEVQKFEQKKEYFTKNGGILLEKQIVLSQGQDIGGGQLKIVSEGEIKKATNNYDPDLIVGSFRGGNIYKGTFDGRIVAIKTPQKPGSNPELVDFFLTEVLMAVVICNVNMVKIYGCCLETCVPMMVYEYYSNNDLYRYLHSEMAFKKPLKWGVRLRVAVDIAYALSYMHNALSKPVVHRGVMSLSILLDSSFNAKLTDFAYSVAITPGKKEQKWPVQGTPGYVDPEYIETQEVTEKCDVYSFGVLMLELLTSRDPVEMARCGKDLVDEFVSEVEISAREMIDKTLLEEDNMDEIQWFTQVALKCVAKKGDERPTMINVVEELWLIQDKANNTGGREA